MDESGRKPGAVVRGDASFLGAFFFRFFGEIASKRRAVNKKNDNSIHVDIVENHRPQRAAARRS